MPTIATNEPKAGNTSTTSPSRIPSTEMPAYTTLWLAVTDACPLGCDYCYVHTKNTHRSMSLDTARRAIALALDEPSLPSGGLRLYFIGGEPLVEIDLIAEVCDWVVDEVRRRGAFPDEALRFRITTNGVLLGRDRVIEFFRRHGSRTELTLSIDGPREVHDAQRHYRDGRGSYDDILAALPAVKDLAARIAVNVTIAHGAMHRIFDSVMHIRELGLELDRMGLAYGEEWTADDAVVVAAEMNRLADAVLDNDLGDDPFFRMVFGEPGFGRPVPPLSNSNNCLAGRTFIAVDADGTIYPCYMALPFVTRNRSARAVGHLDTGIDHNRLRPFRAFDRWSQSPPRCVDCDVAGGCTWCVAFNYDQSTMGSIYERSRHACRTHRAMAEATRYYRTRHAAKGGAA